MSRKDPVFDGLSSALSGVRQARAALRRVRKHLDEGDAARDELDRWLHDLDDMHDNVLNARGSVQ